VMMEYSCHQCRVCVCVRVMYGTWDVAPVSCACYVWHVGRCTGVVCVLCIVSCVCVMQVGRWAEQEASCVLSLCEGERGHETDAR